MCGGEVCDEGRRFFFTGQENVIDKKFPEDGQKRWDEV